MNRVDQLRKIVSESQCAKVEGHLVDLFSASAYLTVYDALSEKNQAKIEGEPLPLSMGMVWRVLGPGSNA